jgi:hypothetical protein
MVEVNKGLKEMVEEDRIPEGDYDLEVTQHILSGSGKGPWIILRAKIAGADDDELIGRAAGGFPLLNIETGQRIGLTRLMLNQHWTELPENEDGERNTEDLVGLRFLGRVTHDDSGRVNCDPIVASEDYSWQEKVMSGEIVPGNGRAPKSRKKKSKKKAAASSRSRGSSSRSRSRSR